MKERKDRTFIARKNQTMKIAPFDALPKQSFVENFARLQLCVTILCRAYYILTLCFLRCQLVDNRNILSPLIVKCSKEIRYGRFFRNIGGEGEKEIISYENSLLYIKIYPRNRRFYYLWYKKLKSHKISSFRNTLLIILTAHKIFSTVNL